MGAVTIPSCGCCIRCLASSCCQSAMQSFGLCTRTPNKYSLSIPSGYYKAGTYRLCSVYPENDVFSFNHSLGDFYTSRINTYCNKNSEYSGYGVQEYLDPVAGDIRASIVATITFAPSYPDCASMELYLYPSDTDHSVSVVYSIPKTSWSCTGTNTFALLSNTTGESAASSVSLVPYPSDMCSVCIGIDIPNTLYFTITGAVNPGFPFHLHVGDVVTLSRDTTSLYNSLTWSYVEDSSLWLSSGTIPLYFYLMGSACYTLDYYATVCNSCQGPSITFDQWSMIVGVNLPAQPWGCRAPIIPCARPILSNTFTVQGYNGACVPYASLSGYISE